MKVETIVNMKQKKFGFQKRITQILFLIILLIDGIALREVNSKPSEKYKKESNCWYNPDFVTRDQISNRYCIKQNGEIIRIDKNGKVYEEKGKLNEVVKINKFPMSMLYEFKIEYDQLVLYSCKGRKYETKSNCKKSSEKIIKGIRPKGYHLNRGLEQKMRGDIYSAINSFHREIDVSNNPIAFLEIALIRNDQNNYIEALKYTEKINDEEYINKDKYYLSSILKYNMKDYKGSIDDIEKLLFIINNDIEKGNRSNQNVQTLEKAIRNNTAYVLVEGPTWEEANINAKKLGGYLVTINDEEENKWLVDNFFDSDKFYSKSSKNKFWIGLSFINEQLHWSSKETFLFTKIGAINSYTNSENLGGDLYGKINILDSLVNSKVDQGSWTLEPGSGRNYNASYGIAEINLLDRFDKVQPKFKTLFFLRGLAKSKLGMSNSAIEDFDKDIEINPLNGQSYFERGVEKYWSDRENACNDMLKGLNLGADYKSYQDFTNGNNLNDLKRECKSIATEVDINKENRYKSNELGKNIILLFKKYSFFLFLLIVIGTITLFKNDE